MPLTVAHIYRDALKPGGVPHQTRQLLEAEAGLGVDLAVLAQGGPEEVPESTRIWRSGHRARDIRRDVARATALRTEIDVCHVTGVSIPEHLASVFALSRAGTPVVLSPHGLLAPLGRDARWEGQPQTIVRKVAKSGYRQLLDRWLVNAASVIHAQSRYEEICIKRVRNSADVVTAPMGVDDEWFQPQYVRESLRRPITVGYLGRLDTYHKGLDLLLAGLERLDANCRREVNVIVAGSPVASCHESLKRHAAALNVPLLSEQWGDEKTDFFSRCDFLYGVYRYAGMARVLGEGVGRGLPIIASREGSWGDWASQFGMGIACDLTSESVANALEKALGLTDRDYARMSEGALEFASTWTWRRVAEELVGAYRSAAETRSVVGS